MILCVVSLLRSINLFMPRHRGVILGYIFFVHMVLRSFTTNVYIIVLKFYILTSTGANLEASIRSQGARIFLRFESLLYIISCVISLLFIIVLCIPYHLCAISFYCVIILCMKWKHKTHHLIFCITYMWYKCPSFLMTKIAMTYHFMCHIVCQALLFYACRHLTLCIKW
jgi:hypothetical protein